MQVPEPDEQLVQQFTGLIGVRKSKFLKVVVQSPIQEFLNDVNWVIRLVYTEQFWEVGTVEFG